MPSQEKKMIETFNVKLRCVFVTHTRPLLPLSCEALKTLPLELCASLCSEKSSILLGAFENLGVFCSRLDINVLRAVAKQGQHSKRHADQIVHLQPTLEECRRFCRQAPKDNVRQVAVKHIVKLPASKNYQLQKHSQQTLPGRPTIFRYSEVSACLNLKKRWVGNIN